MLTDSIRSVQTEVNYAHFPGWAMGFRQFVPVCPRDSLSLVTLDRRIIFARMTMMGNGINEDQEQI